MEVVSIFKESFSNFPLERLRRLYNESTLMREARIAVKELIEEKEGSYFA